MKSAIRFITANEITEKEEDEAYNFIYKAIAVSMIITFITVLI